MPKTLNNVYVKLNWPGWATAKAVVSYRVCSRFPLEVLWFVDFKCVRRTSTADAKRSKRPSGIGIFWNIFLHRFVTGESPVWLEAGSSLPLHPKTHQSVGKIMANIFLDVQGIIESHTGILARFNYKIKNKRPHITRINLKYHWIRQITPQWNRNVTDFR